MYVTIQLFVYQVFNSTLGGLDSACKSSEERGWLRPRFV